MSIAVAAVTVHVVLVELAVSWTAVSELPTWRLVVGIGVFAGGFAFWVWARNVLVPYGRRLDPGAPPPALRTEGPFRVVRHPLAFGMLLLALGPGLAAATVPTWATWIAVAIALEQRCRQDEVEMHAAFGDAYARYARRTARLLPFVW